MLTGSHFYRDNPKLICMGHPDCRRPCRYEPDSVVLKRARRALNQGKISQQEFRCIELDSQGFPGKVIIGVCGGDPTGANAKRARYACERAYSKIGRRLCELCSLLWAHDRPKGPRVDSELQLKYEKRDWEKIRQGQSRGPVKMKRRKRTFSLEGFDRRQL